MTRKALLLGVTEYEDQALSRIGDTAANDVNLLKNVLSFASYDKDNITAIAKPLAIGSIKRHMHGLFDNATPEDALFIYFSGHGCENNDQRYLIPADLYNTDNVEYAQLIKEQDIYQWACNSKAKSVVFMIDACREGVTIEFAADVGAKSIVTHQNCKVGKDKRPTIAFVYSCEKSASAFYGPDGNGSKHSFFAMALAKVLQQDDENPPAKLTDVIEQTQLVLSDIASSHQKLQEIKRSPYDLEGIGGKPDDLLIREDASAAFKISIDQSHWCQRLSELNFWQDILDKEEYFPLQWQIKSIVMAVEKLIESQKSNIAEHLPKPHWRPKDAPLIVLEKLQSNKGLWHY